LGWPWPGLAWPGLGWLLYNVYGRSYGGSKAFVALLQHFKVFKLSANGCCWLLLLALAPHGAAA